MLKNIVFVLSILYTFLLLLLCLISLNNLPKVSISYADKIFHLIAYIIFTLLWFFSFFLRFKVKIYRSITISVLFATLFGIFIEVLQGSLTSTRSFDYYDVLANTTGVIIAAIMLKVLTKKYQKI